MAFFAIYGIDKPGALDVRVANRPDHVVHLKAHDSILRLAGPLLDAEGKMAGSLMVVEVEDQAAAEAFVAADPFSKHGVFQSVEIRPFTRTMGSWS